MISYSKVNRQDLVSRLESAIAAYDGSVESNALAVAAQRRLRKFDANHGLIGIGLYRPTFPKGTRMYGRTPHEFRGSWLFVKGVGVFAG